MRARGGEKETLIARKEPSARGFAAAVGDSMKSGSVRAHHVLLVTRVAVASRLKRQPLSIVAEIRFGIFTTESELSNRCESMLTRSWSDQSRRLCRHRS